MSSNPVLEMISAFKSIHVLNDIMKSKDESGRQRLKATHYACVLINGRSPVWGIWTVTGKFVMFAGSRTQIAEQYPNKSWTVMMASWLLNDSDGDFKDIGKRVRALEDKYGGHIERDTDNRPAKPAASALQRPARAPAGVS